MKDVLIELQWRAARWSAGVTRLVLDGVVPARVPDGVISEIRSRERNGLIEVPKPRGLQPGDRVLVLRGPFVDQFAIYSGTKPRERVEILLSLLNSQRSIQLSARDVAAV